MTDIEPEAATPSCGESGELRVSMVGAIAGDIDWTANDFECESMSRPNGEGLRMRFSGDVNEERLAIIVAIPDLGPGNLGDELSTNITITVEGSGRFFSAPDLESCWTDVKSGDEDTLSGNLYCVSALGELNGDAAVELLELSFTSTIDWSTK